MPTQASKSQRRILRKNGIRVLMAQASFSRKATLFNRHKLERDASSNERYLYSFWLREMAYRVVLIPEVSIYDVEDKLIGVSILDFGEQDISSVYFYFDPDYDRSLGTFFLHSLKSVDAGARNAALLFGTLCR